jgi:polysaccharide biosynthesis/export protein VpsN
LRIFATAMAVGASLLAAACSSTPVQPQPESRPVVVRTGYGKHTPSELDASVYRLGAGDIVRIDVYGEPDLSIKTPVEPSGKINYPFLGQVRAGGLTAPQLKVLLVQGLSNGYLVNPDVRVAVDTYRPIYITGQVKKPGSYPYSLGLTVEQALTLAAGPTDYASMGRIYIQHENLSKNTAKKVPLDSEVLPGDTVLVEERSF